MKSLGGHLLMEIVLGSGFAAVAFTGIALQVSNVKKDQVQERQRFELEMRAKDHVQALRTGAPLVPMKGLEVRGGETLVVKIKGQPAIEIPVRARPSQEKTP